jgi:hypothetical protein
MKTRDKDKYKQESKPTPRKKILKDSKDKENQEEQEERNGIIPEDMDFKKFLGCGG